MKDLLAMIVRQAEEVQSYAQMMLDDAQAGLATAAKRD